jgi:hypothetical protein
MGNPTTITVTPYMLSIRIRELEQEERWMYCKHDKGLDIDPCCGDCGHAQATYTCTECGRKEDREEWEFEHNKAWDDHLYGDAYNYRNIGGKIYRGT